MDAQDKKSKDWTLFGRTEDSAIARAKYKREMGINPSYKTQQNAEVSRSAQSMKNPTAKPYDPKDSAKVAALRKKETTKTFGSRTSGPGQKRMGASGASIESDYRGPNRGLSQRKPAPAAGAPPKPRLKPDRSGAATVRKAEGPKAASDKSSQSGKMTSFQRMKARQFEKEGVAGRSMTRSAAQKKAMEKSGGPKVSLASMKERLSSAFKPKVSGSKPKPLMSAFAKKNLAANQAIGKKK
jgi:hypothetical protein